MKYEEANDDIDSIVTSFIRSFDLGKAPLFRAKMVKAKDKNYLLIDMHHIIADGVSMSILIKEFAQLYNGESLKPLKLQYKDFATVAKQLLKN